MNEIFEMKEYAKENSVPILKDGTRDFIIEYIKMHNIKKILEIGSAIGYSAISFAQTSTDISVDTIEYDFERYQTAFKNVQNHNLADRITVYLGDAADFTTDEKYDLIFVNVAPTKSSNDAVLLAHVIEGFVLVIKRKSTKSTDLDDALKYLTLNQKVNLIGFIATNAKSK